MRGITQALVATDSRNSYLLLTGPLPGNDRPTVTANCQPLELDAPHLMDESWEQVTLPTELASRRTDVLLAPGSIIPIARDFAAIPVIHDLGFLHHPEFYEPGLREYLTKWVEIACRSGEAVICNSEFTRKSVVGAYGIPSGRCHVVYPAPDDRFRMDGAVEPAEGLARRYGFSLPYALTVSSGGPNKNLPRVLQAAAMAFGRGRSLPHTLVIVGADGRAAGFAQELGIRDRVRFLGRVPVEELRALYAGADVFFFPSLYEGFGLPPIEAMASSAPVLASSHGALREVLGDAALLCDPEDVEAMAEALAGVCLDRALRSELGRKGKARSDRFSWARSAEQVLRILEAVGGRN